MENELPRDPSPRSEGQASAAEAQEALEALGVDSARLADRMVTPWWYHPILGVIVATMVGAQTLDTMWAMSLMAACIIALPLLAVSYSRIYGITITAPAGPRSRRLLHLLIATLGIPLLLALAVRTAGWETWWGIPLAVLAGVGTIVLGRRYDEAVRRDLSAAAGERR